ncbi:hypothetical protein [Gymnodinialimonas phycosphaerae]|uniref:hypothetical protein n=1 Tax=Gymnodinialimonas phycosphaerae TaxID=2841589 RepID=UPI003D029E31
MRHVLTGALMMLSTSAFAQPVAVQLDAEEVTQLLSGNTAVGLWEGTPYRQYFGTDGVTLFAQPDARTTRGEWRVDPENDEYQSLWPGDTEWEGLLVMIWMDEYYWLSRTTPPTPFEVLEGEQLVAE